MRDDDLTQRPPGDAAPHLRERRRLFQRATEPETQQPQQTANQ
jgi:hypothetical protein